MNLPAPPDLDSLLPRWSEWIASNALRDCSSESMQAAMVGAGEDAARADALIQQVLHSPILAAARRLQQQHQKLLSVVGNLQAVWETAADYESVERREQIEPEEFQRRHIEGFRPLLLCGHARHWPALQRWQFEALRERFGAQEVQIQSGRDQDARFEENSEALRRQVSFAKFLHYAQHSAPGNAQYLTANNHLLRRPEFAELLDDVGELPPLVDRAQLASQAHLWIGPGGTNTPMHHDCCMLFHTQIVGAKRWRLISPLDWGRMDNRHHVFSPIDLDAPDLLDRHPQFRGARVLDVTVQPGETLFLPLGWWHQVSGLAPSVSISYTGMSCPNSFQYFSPRLD